MFIMSMRSSLAEDLSKLETAENRDSDIKKASPIAFDSPEMATQFLKQIIKSKQIDLYQFGIKDTEIDGVHELSTKSEVERAKTEVERAKTETESRLQAAEAVAEEAIAGVVGKTAEKKVLAESVPEVASMAVVKPEAEDWRTRNLGIIEKKLAGLPEEQKKAEQRSKRYQEYIDGKFGLSTEEAAEMNKQHNKDATRDWGQLESDYKASINDLKKGIAREAEKAPSSKIEEPVATIVEPAPEVRVKAEPAPEAKSYLRTTYSPQGVRYTAGPSLSMRAVPTTPDKPKFVSRSLRLVATEAAPSDALEKVMEKPPESGVIETVRDAAISELGPVAESPMESTTIKEELVIEPEPSTIEVDTVKEADTIKTAEPSIETADTLKDAEMGPEAKEEAPVAEEPFTAEEMRDGIEEIKKHLDNPEIKKEAFALLRELSAVANDVELEVLKPKLKTLISKSKSMSVEGGGTAPVESVAEVAPTEKVIGTVVAEPAPEAMASPADTIVSKTEIAEPPLPAPADDTVIESEPVVKEESSEIHKSISVLEQLNAKLISEIDTIKIAANQRWNLANGLDKDAPMKDAGKEIYEEKAWLEKRKKELSRLGPQEWSDIYTTLDGTDKERWSMLDDVEKTKYSMGWQNRIDNELEILSWQEKLSPKTVESPATISETEAEKEFFHGNMKDAPGGEGMEANAAEAVVESDEEEALPARSYYPRGARYELPDDFDDAAAARLLNRKKETIQNNEDGKVHGQVDRELMKELNEMAKQQAGSVEVSSGRGKKAGLGLVSVLGHAGYYGAKGMFKIAQWVGYKGLMKFFEGMMNFTGDPGSWAKKKASETASVGKQWDDENRKKKEKPE